MRPTIYTKNMSIRQIMEYLTDLPDYRPVNDLVADRNGDKFTSAWRYAACEHYPERWGVSHRPNPFEDNRQYYTDPAYAAIAIKDRRHNDQAIFVPRHDSRCGEKNKRAA